MRYNCKSSTMKDNIPFLGVEYLYLFWIASPIQRINPLSFTIMAGSRDRKRFFCKGSLIFDLSNTLEKELGKEICQTSLNPLDPMDFPSNVRYFPKFSQNSPTRLSKYSSLKFYLGRFIYRNEIISFAFERALYGLSFDILDPYMQLIVCLGFSFGKL